MLCSALRNRGVAFSRSSSPYNAWTGTGTSSNSSGRARFLPIDDEEGMDSGRTAGGGVVFGVARLSGVRALKTTGWDVRRSGVFGRGMIAGPEAVRPDLDLPTGGWVGIAGTGGTSCASRMLCDEETRRVEPALADAIGGGEMIFSITFGVDEAASLAATSLACRLVTLRVNKSTLVVSFFFSLSILWHFISNCQQL